MFMSFSNYFKQHVLEEAKWWGKLDPTQLQEIDVNGKKYHYTKMDETQGPAWLLKTRNGTRYGLFRANQDRFHCIRMKSGKKHLVNIKDGYFTEENGILAFKSTLTQERFPNVI
jgi:hypothetical protein